MQVLWVLLALCVLLWGGSDPPSTSPFHPTEQGPERISRPLAQDEMMLDVQLSFAALTSFAKRAEIA